MTRDSYLTICDLVRFYGPHRMVGAFDAEADNGFGAYMRERSMWEAIDLTVALDRGRKW